VGSREGINEDKPFPRKICGAAASNPRPGDSRQLSPLHQACPSCSFKKLSLEIYYDDSLNILVAS